MMQKTIIHFVVSLFMAGCWATVNGQPRRPMSPPDILRVATVGDPQISPNGSWVVYSVGSVEDDKNTTTLWLVPTAMEPSIRQPLASPTPGRRAMLSPEWPEIRYNGIQLLPPGWSATNARWSPDNTTIAFISIREGVGGLYTINLNRREPRFVAAIQSSNFFITYAGEPFSWSPDSRRIAYISATAETTEAGAIRKPDDPRVIDRIQYKSRTSLSDNKRTHVWIVDVERPEPRQLTSGSSYDHAVSFSPRGDEIVFLSNHEPDPDANNNSDIFSVDTGGQVRQLTQTKGCEYEPVWSPDGKWIAYTATRRELTTIDSVAEDTHVWIIPAAGGAGREVGDDQDRRARNPHWSADGRSVFFLSGDAGCSTIFRTSVDGGRISRFSLMSVDGDLEGDFELTGSKYRSDSPTSADAFQISNLSFGSRGQAASVGSSSGPLTSMAFTLSTPLRSNEVWLWSSNSARLRRASGHNDGFIRSVRLVNQEEVTFRSFDGTQIQGWLMKPLGFREDRKYPLILSIHGGPHGMYGWGFNANFQVYAAQGYAVLFMNPRGSSGYGQKFSDGTINEWGGGDYKDLMNGVDEVLRKNAWIDVNRMGVTGGSYGGFMTNWIITQTQRFKAAVAAASVSNLISFYSTSLYQDLVHAEFGGFPWDNYDLLWQWSPIRYARQVQTPTLFIHGENDNDVHITQAEEMYMALRRRNVDSVFVRYPREGHGLREPKHRLDSLQRTLAWFDRYLK